VSRDKGILVTKKVVFRQVAPVMLQHSLNPGANDHATVGYNLTQRRGKP
jgi:hypothetical protein